MSDERLTELTLTVDTDEAEEAIREFRDVLDQLSVALDRVNSASVYTSLESSDGQRDVPISELLDIEVDVSISSRGRR